MYLRNTYCDYMSSPNKNKQVNHGLIAQRIYNNLSEDSAYFFAYVQFILLNNSIKFENMFIEMLIISYILNG